MLAQADSSRGDCEDIIIEGGILLSMVDGQLPLKNVSIVIRGESIADIRVTDPKAHAPGMPKSSMLEKLSSCQGWSMLMVIQP